MHYHNGMYLSILICITNIYAMEQKSYTKLPEHYTETLTQIFDHAKVFEDAAVEIRQLATKQKEWDRCLSDEECAGKIVKLGSDHFCGGSSPEIVAMILGTSGAVAWCKKYAEDKPAAKKNLNEFLIDIGRWDTPDIALATRILDVTTTPDAIDKGDIIYSENPGATALTTAATYGATALVQLLLDRGANIEIKMPWDSRTAIMAAALDGHIDTLNILISRGANVNAKNCSGTTALHWACKHAHAEVVQSLLAARADTHVIDDSGNTPLQHAKRALFYQHQERYEKIVHLLEQSGAQQ